MEWRHSVLPRPKIPSGKIRWKTSRLDLLGSRTHPPFWLSSKGPNYQRWVLRISDGAIEGHLEGKTPREFHQGDLDLALQNTVSPGTCNPEETVLPGLRLSWSPTLISASGPAGLPPVPWTGKTIEVSPFFVRRGGHWCRETWLGGQISDFFEWLIAVRAKG